MIIQEAIILAGGKGTRLQGVVNDVPKPMALVNGRPFLEYLLDYLDDNVFDHVVLSVGYKNEIIRDHFGNRYKSIDIDYAVEEEPLGTGGAIKKAFELIKERRALVFNGDTMFRLNIERLTYFHQAKSADITIVLREVDNVLRYGSVERDDEMKITGYNEKGTRNGFGLINGGVYLINKNFFDRNDFPEKFSIEKDCFEKMYDTCSIYGLKCRQYFIDIGIPEDYQKAQDDFKRFSY